MWKYKITDKHIKVFSGSERFNNIIGHDEYGFYIPCWEENNPLGKILDRRYRDSHGLSDRGTFPYHLTLEDLFKTVENLWYEDHADYLVDYDVQMYSNIIKFTIGDSVYKFRIRLNKGGYCLNPTTGCMGEFENNLFNHETLGLDQIKWNGVYPTKQELLKFIFDYQRKAKMYKSL